MIKKNAWYATREPRYFESNGSWRRQPGRLLRKPEQTIWCRRSAVTVAHVRGLVAVAVDIGMLREGVQGPRTRRRTARGDEPAFSWMREVHWVPEIGTIQVCCASNRPGQPARGDGLAMSESVDVLDEGCVRGRFLLGEPWDPVAQIASVNIVVEPTVPARILCGLPEDWLWSRRSRIPNVNER